MPLSQSMTKSHEQLEMKTVVNYDRASRRTTLNVAKPVKMPQNNPIQTLEGAEMVKEDEIMNSRLLDSQYPVNQNVLQDYGRSDELKQMQEEQQQPLTMQTQQKKKQQKIKKGQTGSMNSENGMLQYE